MAQINEFEDLTQFVYDEFAKMQETYGQIKPSEDFLKFNEKTLTKYTKLYNKPLLKKEKRKVKLQYKKSLRDFKIMEAIDTMPHGFIWKFFHADLWRVMKYRNKELQEEKKKPKEKKKEEIKTFLPEVLKQTSLPSLGSDEDA